jgi:putative endonuclease
MDGSPLGPLDRTAFRRGRRGSGDRAEAFVAERLREVGWRIVGRQVPVGRDELDIVAVEPSSGGAPGPGTLVFVEVRSARDGRFGAPEESVVGRKAARTYRAALALLRAGALPDGRALPHLPWRVDVVAVTGLGTDGADGPAGALPLLRVRHVRGIDPG